MATIRELIEGLEEMAAELGDNAEIRLMTQQSWPFDNELFGLTTSREIAYARGDDDEFDDDDSDADCDADDVGYIVEGRQLCYGDKRAWDVARTL